jgi:hypothetical protein
MLFVALFLWDNSAEQKRVEDRERIRQAQITRGDREVRELALVPCLALWGNTRLLSHRRCGDWLSFACMQLFTTADGDTRSKLKPVDDEWIIRRLDRWGVRACPVAIKRDINTAHPSDIWGADASGVSDFAIILTTKPMRPALSKRCAT